MPENQITQARHSRPDRRVGARLLGLVFEKGTLVSLTTYTGGTNLSIHALTIEDFEAIIGACQKAIESIEEEEPNDGG